MRFAEILTASIITWVRVKVILGTGLFKKKIKIVKLVLKLFLEHKKTVNEKSRQAWERMNADRCASSHHLCLHKERIRKATLLHSTAHRVALETAPCSISACLNSEEQPKLHAS